jgi:hypothetical protein
MVGGAQHDERADPAAPSGPLDQVPGHEPAHRVADDVDRSARRITGPGERCVDGRLHHLSGQVGDVLPVGGRRVGEALRARPGGVEVEHRQPRRFEGRDYPVERRRVAVPPGDEDNRDREVRLG